MIKIECKDGLLFTSLEIFFRGNSLVIDNIVIDTGAAETIISPDVVEEIGIFAELEDYVHSFYGVGGSLHNFFSKQIDGITLGGIKLNKTKLDFGVVDPQGQINGLLGLDILMRLKAVIDLEKLNLSLKV